MSIGRYEKKERRWSIGITLILVAGLISILVVWQMGGFAPSVTYTFDGESGLKNNQISFVDESQSGSNYGVRAVGAKSGKLSVVELWDNDTTFYPALRHDFGELKRSGYISFYALSTNAMIYSQFELVSPNHINLFTLKFHGRELMWTTGDGIGRIPCSSNTWYFIEIEWLYYDADGVFVNQISLSINGVKRVDQGKMTEYQSSSTEGVQYFDIQGRGMDSGYSIYLDNVNEIW